VTTKPEQVPLPSRWAFVVQFSAETDAARERFVGRVEHVVTGQAAHFETREALVAFLARVLIAVRASDPCEPRGERSDVRAPR
jgi:hypothetical protein